MSLEISYNFSRQMGVNIGYPFINHEKDFLSKSRVTVVLYEIRKNAIFCRKQTLCEEYFVGIRYLKMLF